MNEQIKQFVKQAGEEIKAEYEDERCRNRRLYNEIFLPKFAELIIQDCISQIALIGLSNIENEDIAWTAEHSIKSIKEHFGIT
jgi:hypothetical protein